MYSYMHTLRLNFATPRTAAHQTSLSFTIFQSLLKLMSIESVMPSNHLILSSPSSSAFNLSQHQGLFCESALCTRWPKYRSFGFSISLSNEYSGLISFRRDWLDLLAVQGTLGSLLQYHSSKESILWSSLSISIMWVIDFGDDLYRSEKILFYSFIYQMFCLHLLRWKCFYS